ncbi:MAG TPA: tetratricopeptide repeat protein [Verrucomicrobiae bacterium]|nr:tetratricopeptide repeat protein [Verrucomicrobiae bacterium]
MASQVSQENRWTDRAIVAGIFATAFAVRLIYVYQIRSMPLFYNLGGDALAYDLWAHRIRAGDWIGQGVFYQAPLYPYFLAGFEFFFGHDIWRIRVAQAALGAAACPLVYIAGRDFFSRAVGIAAALLMTFYAPAIFYAALVDKTALDPVLVALLLVILRPGSAAFSAARALGAGVVLGVLGLSRENALVWTAFVPFWIAQHSARRFITAAFFVAGVALILLPVGLRNFAVGGYFTPTTAQAGPNFFIGNNPAADGSYGSIRRVTGDLQFEEAEATWLAEQAAGRSLSPGEVSRYWFGRSWQFIQSEPVAWAKLTARKWLLAWNAREIEDSDDFYIYQRWSMLAAALDWIDTFATLAPLAALGCALLWSERRRLWLLYFMTLSFALTVALFFIFGRYRFPVVPLLALFAGAGVVEAFAQLKRRRFERLALGAAALVTAAAFVNAPLAGARAPSAQGYNNLAIGYLVVGNRELAVANLGQSLRLDPNFGVAHFNLANLYANQGRRAEAIAEYRETIRLYPRFVTAYVYLGKDLAEAGDSAGAIEQYRAALAIRPNAQAHSAWGDILSQRGRTDEAVEHYREAIRLDGGFLPARQALALILIRRGEVDQAAEQYRAALGAAPRFVEGHNNLGLILASRGKVDEAIAQYREALKINPDFALAHVNLGDALLLQGKTDEAIAEINKALELDPNLISARRSLDNALRAKQRRG